MKLFLDLDGVFADFDGGFLRDFGVPCRPLEDDILWGYVNSKLNFFRDLPICEGSLDFFERVRHLDPIFLTACPRTNYAEVAKQKRAWVREHLSTDHMILPVMGGHNKPLFMHNPGDVLVDDFSKNTDAWIRQGGIGVLHRNWPDTTDAVYELFGERMVA